MERRRSAVRAVPPLRLGAARGDTAGGNGAHALAVVRVLEAGARSMAGGGAPVEVA